MTTHAAEGRKLAARVAGQVKAELARHDKTANDLAAVLGVNPHTVGRRLSGRTDFTAVELMTIAKWLEVDLSVFLAHEATAKAAS